MGVTGDSRQAGLAGPAAGAVQSVSCSGAAAAVKLRFGSWGCRVGLPSPGDERLYVLAAVLAVVRHQGMDMRGMTVARP